MYEVAAALLVHGKNLKSPADPAKAEDDFYEAYAGDPLSAVSRLIRHVKARIATGQADMPSRHHDGCRHTA
ncbi:hypothetical protein J5J10_14745 [Ciceribacter sp. L1K23]|uniref:hypothetical protein n=1 Tax=unclassified Ciceribacter TaxID=2628820 RepID=UPI001ABDAE63|nr:MULTISPECIES: hypothetical protein [unclassified Ciceribacter]MBO3758911.1 hypothetical protein [Ciceribacter sp. L1K22]MBR0556943.1 hypothetical protein [Ciceribacter sp. L1K23]